MLATIALYWWLRLGVVRFLEAYPGARVAFYSSIGVSYLLVGVLSTISAAIIFPLIVPGEAQVLFVLGIVLLWTQPLYEIALESARAQLSPFRYGLMSVGRAALSLGFGVVLAYLGWGTPGVVCGLLLGTALPLLFPALALFEGSRLRHLDLKLCGQLWSFGAPLAAKSLFDYGVAVSGRLSLAVISGGQLVGPFAASFDLAHQAVTLGVSAVYLAAYPLVVRALEREGVAAARLRLTEYVLHILAVGIPITIGLAIVAPNIAEVALGSEFREAAKDLIPWMAIGGLLSAIKAHYLDLSFQLAGRTSGLAWIGLVSLTTSVIAGVSLIPAFGAIGAAVGNLVGYLAGIVLTLIVGRSLFPMPLPGTHVHKILIAAFLMTLVLVPLRDLRGAGPLLAQVCIGGATYLFALIVQDAFGARARFLMFVRNRR
jgi:O-antigen/teichoic acid export membrane protein